MITKFRETRDKIQNSIKEVAVAIYEANRLALEAINDCNEAKFKEAKEKLRNLSQKTHAIDNEIVKAFALYSPEARDLRLLVAYLKATNELLRASTNTKNFIKGFNVICQKLDEKVRRDYAIPMHKETVNALEVLVDMIDARGDSEETQECFRNIVVYENKTDDLSQMIEADLIAKLKEESDFDTINKIISSFRKSEKIADRVLSIASLLLYAEIGGELYQDID